MSMTQVDPNAGGSAARSTRGITPVYLPRLRGEELDIQINEMTMTMTEGQHDAATLTCVSTTLEDTEGMLDAPISFYWGIAPRTEIFYGYITDVGEEQGSQGSLSFKLSILGMTKMMFEGTPRFWSNKSVTSAARDLTNTSQLGLGGHVNSFAWSAIAQTEESDWQMIRKLARRCGWVVFSRYGVVLYYDPGKLFKDSGSYTRLMSGLDDLGSTDRTMISFDATEAGEMLHANLGMRIGYFTTNTSVQVAKQSGEFKGYLFETGITVRNQSEAEEYILALDTSFNDWTENAIARIWGDADIYPGMVVDVITAQPRYRFSKTDGRWLVRSVGHQADRQQFQTIIFLTRPERNVTPTDNIYRAFWDDEPSGARAKPKISLVEDRWVSSWRTVAP